MKLRAPLGLSLLLVASACLPARGGGGRDKDAEIGFGDAGLSRDDTGPMSPDAPNEREDTGPAKTAPFEKPSRVWTHGNPSNDEQALLERVQRARANPAAEGRIIVAVPEAQSAIEYFDVNKNRVVSDFQSYEAVPPLAFDARLMQSARVHSIDMAENEFQEHEGSAGESPWDRLDDAGYEYIAASENIYAYAESVDECNAAFLIDWGNVDLGHRAALLDFEDRMVNIGISIIAVPDGREVGPYSITQDFGTTDNETRYVVGVAYHDRNRNEQYDAGEGQAGLDVVLDRGNYHAVTSASGGYAIPVAADAGSLRIQLQASSRSVVQENEVEVEGENVKVDFVL